VVDRFCNWLFVHCC